MSEVINNDDDIEIVEVAPNTPEWDDLRMKVYKTASRAPKVRGELGTWSELARDIAGIKTPVTPAMQRGIYQEPFARAAVSRNFGLELAPMVFQRGEYLASIDATDPDLSCLFEIKTPIQGTRSKAWELAEDGEMLPYHRSQIVSQLAVSGIAKGELVIWDAESRIYITVPVYPDEQMWAETKAYWADFEAWMSRRNDQAWLSAAKQWTDAKDQLTVAQDLEDKARARLQALMGDAEFSIGGGVEVARSYRRGAVDWKSVEAKFLAEADLDEFRKPGQETLTIRKVANG